MLEEALKANRGSIGEQTRFVETDLEFHFVLARIANNPNLHIAHDCFGRMAWQAARGVGAGRRDAIGGLCSTRVDLRGDL